MRWLDVIFIFVFVFWGWMLGKVQSEIIKLQKDVIALLKKERSEGGSTDGR